jgi:hypothetical protein
VFGLLDHIEFQLEDYELWELKSVKRLADKHGLPTLPKLLAKRLWMDDGYDLLWVFAAAVQLGNKHLIRYACSRVRESFPPSGLHWLAIQKLKLEAYYLLSTTENDCKPFSWKSSLSDLSLSVSEDRPLNGSIADCLYDTVSGERYGITQISGPRVEE